MANAKLDRSRNGDKAMSTFEFILLVDLVILIPQEPYGIIGICSRGLKFKAKSGIHHNRLAS